MVDVLAKQKAAAAVEAKALESAGISRQRITDWAQATNVAQKENQTVTSWVKQAGDENKLRSGLRAAVEARLGPIPIVDPAQVAVLTNLYELELYRAKFRALGSFVQTVYLSRGATPNPRAPSWTSTAGCPRPPAGRSPAAPA